MEEKVLSVLRRREGLENGVDSRVWDLTGAQWHLITHGSRVRAPHKFSRQNGFSSISKRKWIKHSSIFSVTQKTPNIIPIYKVKVKSLSRVRLFATPWTVAYQAPPSVGFSRQEYWSGLPFPSPGDLPNPRIEPGSPTLQADALTSAPPGKPLHNNLKRLGLIQQELLIAQGFYHCNNVF